MRPAERRRPRPQSSTPQLFDTTSRSPTSASTSASMRTDGIPDTPNPPEASEAPLWISSTARAAEDTTLSMCSCLSVLATGHEKDSGESARADEEGPGSRDDQHGSAPLEQGSDLHGAAHAEQGGAERGHLGVADLCEHRWGH